jgi:hypothetical protein
MESGGGRALSRHYVAVAAVHLQAALSRRVRRSAPPAHPLPQAGEGMMERMLGATVTAARCNFPLPASGRGEVLLFCIRHPLPQAGEGRCCCFAFAALSRTRERRIAPRFFPQTKKGNRPPLSSSGGKRALAGRVGRASAGALFPRPHSAPPIADACNLPLARMLEKCSPSAGALCAPPSRRRRTPEKNQRKMDEGFQGG